MLLVTPDIPKQAEKTKVTFWTRGMIAIACWIYIHAHTYCEAMPTTARAEELPGTARLRMIVVSSDKHERRNPIKMCANHQQEWSEGKHIV